MLIYRLPIHLPGSVVLILLDEQLHPIYRIVHYAKEIRDDFVIRHHTTIPWQEKHKPRNEHAEDKVLGIGTGWDRKFVKDWGNSFVQAEMKASSHRS